METQKGEDRVTLSGRQQNSHILLRVKSHFECALMPVTVLIPEGL